jgi:hypothetical protein
VILLAGTSDAIRLVTSAVCLVDVHASFVDLLAGQNVIAGRKNTAIATATTTVIVESPAASVARNVKTLTIRNKHATDPVVVKVLHTDGTTEVEMVERYLNAGQELIYDDASGWKEPV